MAPTRWTWKKEFAAHADELSLYSHRFIAGYVKVMRKRQWLPSDCQLTKREVECLRWAAIGKTDKEISMILSRSHATVRFHIQNAGEKLDAVNAQPDDLQGGAVGISGAGGLAAAMEWFTVHLLTDCIDG